MVSGVYIYRGFLFFEYVGYCINIMFISVHSSLFVELMFPVESLNDETLNPKSLMLTGPHADI